MVVRDDNEQLRSHVAVLQAQLVAVQDAVASAHHAEQHAQHRSRELQAAVDAVGRRSCAVALMRMQLTAENQRLWATGPPSKPRAAPALPPAPPAVPAFGGPSAADMAAVHAALSTCIAELQATVQLCAARLGRRAASLPQLAGLPASGTAVAADQYVATIEYGSCAVFARIEHAQARAAGGRAAAGRGGGHVCRGRGCGGLRRPVGAVVCLPEIIVHR